MKVSPSSPFCLPSLNLLPFPLHPPPRGGRKNKQKDSKQNNKQIWLRTARVIKQSRKIGNNIEPPFVFACPSMFFCV